MKITLGRNIASLQVQRQLGRSTDRVNSVFERLSSGQRINRAADDPAGMAVAMKLQVETRIANQAKQNVSMGVSLLQVADSALNSIRSLVQRQAELAEQAANDVLSNEQRKSLQSEYTQLDLEIRRITASTEFNGIDLLAGEQSANAAHNLGITAWSNYKQIDISGDGRYGIYFNMTDSRLEQMDFETGSVTVIANGGVGPFSQSAGGERVVFSSNSNLTGEDPSGFGQVYVWDRNTGEIEQITNAAGIDGVIDPNVANITISADGSTIAFSSTTRYNSDGSVASYSALNFDITTVNLDTGIFSSAAVNLTTPLDFLSLSSDGSHLAFTSQNDLTGDNADTNTEIFTYEVANPVSTLTQVTQTVGGAGFVGVQVSNNGDVFFAAQYDLTGENPSNFGQVFKYNSASDSLSQLTNSLGGNIILDRLSADGTSLYLRGAGNLTGENPATIRQAFELSLATGEVTQLTDYSTSPIDAQGRISGDGRYLFQSTAGNILQIIDLRPDDLQINIETGSGEDGLINASLSGVRSALSGLGGMLISSKEAARETLNNTLSNIETLGQISGTIGASMSRLASANRTLHSLAQEKEAARSRIIDADIAQEAAELTKSQILQQVAAALLAQTNISSQIALRLLTNN